MMRASLIIFRNMHNRKFGQPGYMQDFARLSSNLSGIIGRQNAGKYLRLLRF